MTTSEKSWGSFLDTFARCAFANHDLSLVLSWPLAEDAKLVVEDAKPLAAIWALCTPVLVLYKIQLNLYWIYVIVYQI